MSKKCNLGDTKFKDIIDAVRSDDFEKLKQLMTGRGDAGLAGVKALHVAIAIGRLEMIRYLLELGVDSKKKDWWDKEMMTPLHRAVTVGSNDDSRVVELLLQHNADPNVKDRVGYPLHTAIQKENVTTTKLLLNRGADPGYRDKLFPLRMHYSIIIKNASIRNLLIKHGTDIFTEEMCGRSFLDLALKEEEYEFVLQLLQMGMSVNHIDHLGRTPLHSLLTDYWNNDKKLVGIQFLIDHGANVNATDDENKTPLFYAVQKRNKQLVDCLLKNGALFDCKNSLSPLRAAFEDGCVDDGKPYPMSSKDLCHCVEFIAYLMSKGARLKGDSNEIRTKKTSKRRVNVIRCNIARVNMEMRSSNHNSFLMNNAILRMISSKRIVEDKYIGWQLVRLLMKNNLTLDDFDYNIFSEDLQSKFNDYRRELETMRTTKMCDGSNITYFDFLVNRGNTLREECARKIIEDNQLFPVMADILKANLPSSLKRRQMLDDATTLLFKIFVAQLPYEVVEMIIVQFDDIELTILLA